MFRPAVALIRFYQSKNTFKIALYNLRNGVLMKNTTLLKLYNNIPISIFVKIRSVGAKLFYADGRTDGRTSMTILIIAFRNFPKAPKRREIIIIFLHGVGRLTCCGINAFPSFPRAFTISSSSRFVEKV